MTPAQKKAAAHYAALRSGELECPECGDHGPHDDNGAFGDELVFYCRTCGTHFEPEALEL